MQIERRRFPRYAFVATVHIKEMLSQTELIARTRNISLGGCFVETSTPLAAGVPVRVTISQAGSTFRALGNVLLSLDHEGMRITFESFSPDQEAILRTWIEVAKHGSLNQIS